MQSIGSLRQMSYGLPVGKENRMIVTGIIVLGVAAYAVWAVRKIHRDRKNGSCCGGSCSGCVGQEYCSK